MDEGMRFVVVRECAHLRRRPLHRVGVMAILAGMICFRAGGATEAVRPKITEVAFVRIGVADMQTASKFYHEELKLPKVNCTGQSAECYFLSPSQQVELVKMEAAPRGNRIDTIGLYTTDAKALRQYLSARGEKPEDITKDSEGRISFRIKDPEGHLIQFIQWTNGMAGSVAGGPPLSSKMIHVGFVVKDRAAMDHFYKDILGFRLYWSGGMKDGETSWVAMQVPDGTDWVEYMLNISDNADKHTLGVMNHISLGVVSVKAAKEQLEKAGVVLGAEEQPKIGRDGKWQLNLYDPDGTRVELMEFTPVEKPCCSEFTGEHPKP
jgi:catechol 2,3-dioxygenase-like lactoylglutathione lyase family enzyme